MMSVKYKINIKDIEGDGGELNFPVEMMFNTVDQAETVEIDFVQKEVEKAINPIIDYEKSRFLPVDKDYNEMFNIGYELNFINSNGIIPTQTFFSDLGFENDDIKFRKNGFIRSFLRINFYDNDVPSNQRLLSFITIYCKVGKKDINPIGSPNAGLPISANQFPVKFILKNPIKEPDGFAEGFYIYHYKDEVLENLPKELFMRAEFNNAKTGERTSFITVNTPQSIDNIIKKLHTKYILKRNSSGFYYEVDESYSTNVVYTSDVDGNGNFNDGGVKIILYEIQVI